MINKEMKLLHNEVKETLRNSVPDVTNSLPMTMLALTYTVFILIMIASFVLHMSGMLGSC